MAKKKKKEQPSEPRNWNAVNAHFRKAGAMKDKRKKRNKDDREYLEDIEDDTKDN